MNKFREYHLFNILQVFDNSNLPLDSFLRNYFRSNKAIGAKDRRYIAETIYGMIRWRGLLDYLTEKPYSWQNRYSCYLKTYPQNYREKKDIPIHIRASFPKHFFHLLEENYGQENAFSFCQISNTQAPTTIRVNLLKITREQLLSAWENKYNISPTKYSSCGITFHKKINFFDSEEFKAGYFEVQDEGSQLIGDLIKAKPHDHVLDFCAGSGGKTLAFAPKMNNKGVVYLHDIRSHALEEAKKRLKRAGVQNAQIIHYEHQEKIRLKGKMDWVLADVPCSGTGTLRRNPDMKWRFDPKQLEPLLQEQREIFEQALQYLKPEGKIVYATCSVLSQENESQIDYFQKKFSLTLDSTPFTSHPTEGGMDGFFAAVLKKQ